MVNGGKEGLHLIGEEGRWFGGNLSKGEGDEMVEGEFQAGDGWILMEHAFGTMAGGRWVNGLGGSPGKGWVGRARQQHIS